MTPRAPIVLAFDTSGANCAASLLSASGQVTSRCEQMARGQAERLMPMLQEMLAAQGITWRDLTAIGVGIGPGNFTGIRIAVSAARGLALGLNVPAYGVDGFEARRHVLGRAATVAIPAPRDQVFVAHGDALPVQIASAEAAARYGPMHDEPDPALIAEAIAHCAAARWPGPATPPAPVYLRAADAAPARDAPPVLLD